MFGNEKGAFAGAQQAEERLIETADAGTPFLEEVGELAAAGRERYAGAVLKRAPYWLCIANKSVNSAR